MTNNVKLAVKNIDKFNGTVEFEDWYRDFDATADAMNLEEQEKYQALVLVLDKDVLTRIMA